MLYSKVPFANLLLICLLESGLAIRCWKCTTETDVRCAEPFDNSTHNLYECPAESKSCKWVRIVEEFDPVPTFIRDCGNSKDINCIEQDTELVCYCNSSDGCNAKGNLEN